MKGKVNDNFILSKNFRENNNIYETHQMFCKIEKCVEYLYQRKKYYKKNEKLLHAYNKIVREIEIEKK